VTGVRGVTDFPTADIGPSEVRVTAGSVPSGTTRTTTEPAPSAPLTLAPVAGLQAIGGDSVGFCGPDGCFPAEGTGD